jgi:hypothetical protein
LPLRTAHRNRDASQESLARVVADTITKLSCLPPGWLQ